MKTNINAMRAIGVCFMHFRLLDALGNALPYGGATVAYKVEEDGSIVHSASRCRNDELTGKRDNFNRKIGAAIAGGRVLAYINSHGKNKCALRGKYEGGAEAFRKLTADQLSNQYGYVRDFQAKVLHVQV